MKLKTGATLFATAMLAFVLAFALVGCGGDANDSAADGVTTYTIGVASPFTQGSVAQGQDIKRGAQLAIETFNDSDEARDAGIQFRMVEGDDMGDPKTAVTVANTLVSDSNLIGVVGHYNSGASIPASKVYSDAGVVMVSPGSTNPDLTRQGLPGVFRTCATDDLQGPAGAQYALDMGYTTAVVIDDSTPYGEGLATFFAEAFEELGGEVLMTEKTKDVDTDFNALATRISAENPDIVFYGGMYNAGALFSKQLTDAGVAAPVMGGDGIQEQDWIDLAGDAAEGDYATNVGAPIDSLPSARVFVEDYEDRFGEPAGTFSAFSYDAAMAIMKAAVEASAEVSSLTSPAGREALLDALENIRFDGVTGEISFDENGDTNNKIISLYRVEDGEWVFVDPASIQ
ncbi:MAG: branched-chain amino acid ABC transporter substrate-binding protein [Coriobacteriia bacterium]|nr:branched-chain amino acid ABC transporter substrate-binding protein [Coriobacteriia bacterium]